MADSDAFDQNGAELFSEFDADVSHCHTTPPIPVARRRAEQELRARERRYREILESAHEGIWGIDPEQYTTFVNAKMAEMLGRTPADLIGKPVTDLLPPEMLDVVKADLDLVRSGTPVHREYWMPRPNGTRFYFLLNAFPLFDDAGHYDGIVGMFTDISPRKRAEDELVRSEQRFHYAVRATRNVVWDWEVASDRRWWSDRFWEDFGYDPSSFPPGRAGWIAMVHPDDRHIIDSPAHGAHWTAEYRMRRADGTWAWVLDRAYILTDAKGKCIRMIGALADVTEAKTAEHDLRASEERYRNLFERSLCGVVRTTLDGTLLEGNASFRRICGYDSADELAQFNLQQLYIDPRERETVIQEVLEQGSIVNRELRWRRKDGSPITVLASIAVVNDLSTGSNVLHRTILEITETRKLQEQLLQSQKMDAVGKLAGGIAHDFNNLLMVISSYAELLLDSPLDERQSRHAEQILKASNRAADLTRQLLAFSRKQVMAPRLLELNDIVTDIGKMMPPVLGESVQVEFALASDLGRIKADPTQIQQVIVNLVLNARDAMPQGGRMVIETANAELDQHADMVPGCYVMLAVTDTGTGIDPEVLPTSSNRSSPPRSRARAPAWDSPPYTASFNRRAVTYSCTASWGAGPRSSSIFRATPALRRPALPRTSTVPTSPAPRPSCW